MIESTAFGVKCDGATDDTTALQAAYAAAAGRILKIQKGTCITSATLNFNVQGQQVIGASYNDTIIKINTAANDVINLSANNQTLSNIQVASTVAAASRTGNGISLTTCFFCMLDHVQAIGHNIGIYVPLAAGGSIRNSLSSGNKSHGIMLDAWLNGSPSLANIDEFELTQTEANTNGGSGFYIKGGTNSTGIAMVRPTAANNTGSGITLNNPDGAAGHAVQDVWISMPEMSANGAGNTAIGQIDASTNTSALSLTIDGGGLIECSSQSGYGIHGGTTSTVQIGNVPIIQCLTAGIFVNGTGGNISGTSLAANAVQLELGASSSGYVLSGIQGQASPWGTSATGLKIDGGAGSVSCTNVDFSSSTTPLSGSFPAGSAIFACPSKTSYALGAGVAGNLAYYGSSTTLAADSLANVNSGDIALGVGGFAQGTLTLNGSTSGSTRLQPASATPSGTLSVPSATDTLVGKATTDTLTNKTFDTAGTGNSFLINGLAATANTGTGAVVRATSPTFLTSIFDPLVIGGTGVSSTLTFQSTSGAGSSDAIIFQTGSQVEKLRILSGGNVGIGSNNPGATLTVNGNTQQNLPVLSTGTNIQIIGANSSGAALEVSTFGAVNIEFSQLLYRQATGTAASPGQTGAQTILGLFSGVGYTNSGAWGGTSGQFRFITSEAWTSTAQGEYIQFLTTPTGGTATAMALQIQPSGGLSIGTVTDPGVGGLQVNAQQFIPNITTTSAAQTGTVCWTTGTGKFTADTTVGCLTSLLSAKNINERLAPSSALNIVDRLNPFSFHYKPGWGDSGRYEQFGLGAEEVAEVDERLVGRDTEGQLQGVRYQEMTAVLVGAIKQLKADNDNLRDCQSSWKCRIFGR